MLNPKIICLIPKVLKKVNLIEENNLITTLIIYLRFTVSYKLEYDYVY